jgi:hypothetical protein
MQRLEMMKHLALQVKAQAEGQIPGQNPGQTIGASADAAATRGVPWRRAHIIVLAWFSLGVLTSGSMGVGALLGLRVLESRGTPVTWASVRTMLGATWSTARTKVASIGRKPAPAPDGPWERMQVAIDRGARQHAPLGLRVTGADDRSAYFVLDGVPKGVRLSHGALVGPTTWVLRRADLDGLHLTLDDAAPGTFDLKIAVLAPNGVAKSGSLVQVRLVDGAAPMQAAVEQPNQPKAEAPAASLAYAAPKAAGAPAARAEEKSGRPAAAPAQAAASAARVWPEGAYGLGAVSREPEPAGPKAPAWSPFLQDSGQQP